MKRLMRTVPVILILIAVILQTQCAVNPVTGKKEIMLISQQQEINMGREIDRGLKLQYGLYDDPRLQQYVSDVGHSLVPYTHRPNLVYHFAILDTPVENAFAAPGGYIYITRGLMAMVNSEAELATILGHELGHVNARHSARHMTRAILFTVGIVLFSELSEDFRKIAPLSMVATQLLFLKYSRSDEYQADRLGIEYARKAGYSPVGLVDFFGSLQNLTEAHGGHKIPNFLSTHPLTAKRIDKAKQQLLPADYPPPGSSVPVVKRRQYKQSINGIIYGNNPRQGYREGNAFYHPDMRFYFHVPAGWKLGNTPRQVTMTAPGDKALILLMAETSNERLDAYAVKIKKEFSNSRVLNERFGTVNGFNAFRSSLYMEPDNSGSGGGEPVNIGVSCIRKGGIVYSFVSVAKESDYSSYSYSINRTVNSFNALSGSRYIRRNPKRLVVKRVGRAQSLRYFLSNQNIPRGLWKPIALVNGMLLGDRLRRNQLVKVIK